MRFILVSAEDASNKRKIDIPDELVVKKRGTAKNIIPNKIASKEQKPHKNKKKRSINTRKKAVQQSKSVIQKHGSVHYNHKRKTKSM